MMLLRPFAGAVIFTVMAFLRPQDLAGGMALHLRLSLLVLAATGAGLGIGVFRKREQPLIRLPFLALIGALLVSTWIASHFAVFPDLAFDQWREQCERAAGVTLLVVLCSTRQRLRALLLTLALSLEGLAAISLADPIWDNGRLSGAGGQFRDSNDLALAMNMLLPLLIYLRREEANRWLRAFLTAGIPIAVVTVILTYSRGGFIALAIVALMWVLFSRGRVIRIALAPILAILFMSYAPPAYLTRMTTIKSYQHDSSSRDRLSSWKVANRIAHDRPWTGVGPGNFTAVYSRYTTDFRAPHVAHNAFLQILADAGIPALAIFLALLAHSLFSAHIIASRARAFRSRLLRGGTEDGARQAGRITWIEHYAQGLAISLLAFAAGAQFLSRDDFDLLYMVLGLSGAVALVARRELKLEGCSSRTVRVRAAREPVRVQPSSPSGMVVT